jgi:uncharacterized protein (TIGR00369 family)
MSLTKAEIQRLLDNSPFIAFLKMEVKDLDAEKQQLTIRTPMRPEFERGAGTGQWHGGPIAAVIDTVGDYAAALVLGRPLPTVNFRVDYIRPAMNTALNAVGIVRRLGKSVGVVDVDVFDDRGALVAIGRATYSTMAPT